MPELVDGVPTIPKPRLLDVFFHHPLDRFYTDPLVEAGKKEGTVAFGGSRHADGDNGTVRRGRRRSDR